MSSTSETGHAKNISHFASLISFCNGYGSKYNPSREALKIASLNTLKDAATTSLDKVRNAKEDYDKAVNARRDLFKPLKKLATKIVNALDATEATQATVDDARTINHKIQGTRAGEKAEVPPPDPATPAETPAHKTISVSQQSYDQEIEHFADLISIVAGEPTYAPNEEDLTIVSLNKLLTDMKKDNQAVKDAITALENSRLNRNAVLYKESTGLVDIALDVKKYVKSVYGSGAPEYKQISGLEFKTPDDV